MRNSTLMMLCGWLIVSIVFFVGSTQGEWSAVIIANIWFVGSIIVDRFEKRP